MVLCYSALVYFIYNQGHQLKLFIIWERLVFEQIYSDQNWGKFPSVHWISLCSGSCSAAKWSRSRFWLKLLCMVCSCCSFPWSPCIRWRSYTQYWDIWRVARSATHLQYCWCPQLDINVGNFAGELHCGSHHVHTLLTVAEIEEDVPEQHKATTCQSV